MLMSACTVPLGLSVTAACTCTISEKGSVLPVQALGTDPLTGMSWSLTSVAAITREAVRPTRRTVLKSTTSHRFLVNIYSPRYPRLPIEWQPARQSLASDVERRTRAGGNHAPGFTLQNKQHHRAFSE